MKKLQPSDRRNINLILTRLGYNVKDEVVFDITSAVIYPIYSSNLGTDEHAANANTVKTVRPLKPLIDKLLEEIATLTN